jgi:oligopeptide transport system substrate-binding protein
MTTSDEVAPQLRFGLSNTWLLEREPDLSTEGETDDEVLDRAHGGGLHAVHRPSDRVRDLDDDGGVPGDRNRLRRRGLVGSSGLRRAAGGGAALRTAVIAFALLAGSVVPVWAQQSSARAEPLQGGVYRRPLGHDPKTLDPARVRDVYSLTVTGQIFDGLVQYDQTLTILPGLAQFWKASRDNLTWTFMLRKGVKFHDGRELTADDVVYSLTRLLDPRIDSVVAGFFTTIAGAKQFRAGQSSRVSGLVAVDRYTVQVTLAEAPLTFVAGLALGHARIVPRAPAQRADDAFGEHPIGTGPFKFVRWDHGREIVLDANPDYFAGPPRLSRVVCRIFPGDPIDAMYEEFKLGRLEEAPIPTRTYRGVLADRSHVYVRRPTLRLRLYALNNRMKPLDDRRVRQAMIYGINREALASDVSISRYTWAQGILPPGTLGFNPKLKGYPYDPELARELLSKAGYPGGRGLPHIPVWSSVKRDEVVREQERMKRDLAAIGIHIDLAYHTDWPSFSQMFTAGKLPVFLVSWSADFPDPDQFLFRLFHSRSPSNMSGYANPIVDDLLEEARRAADVQRRVDLYRRAEQIIMDDAAVIPISHAIYERLFQPYVRSIEVSALGDPYLPLRNVWLDRGR